MESKADKDSSSGGDDTQTFKTMDQFDETANQEHSVALIWPSFRVKRLIKEYFPLSDRFRDDMARRRNPEETAISSADARFIFEKSWSEAVKVFHMMLYSYPKRIIPNGDQIRKAVDVLTELALGGLFLDLYLQDEHFTEHEIKHEFQSRVFRLRKIATGTFRIDLLHDECNVPPEDNLLRSRHTEDEGSDEAGEIDHQMYCIEDFLKGRRFEDFLSSKKRSMDAKWLRFLRFPFYPLTCRDIDERITKRMSFYQYRATYDIMELKHEWVNALADDSFRNDAAESMKNLIVESIKKPQEHAEEHTENDAAENMKNLIIESTKKPQEHTEEHTENDAVYHMNEPAFKQEDTHHEKLAGGFASTGFRPDTYAKHSLRRRAGPK